MANLTDEQIAEGIPDVLASILDIVGVFNSPQRDAAMLESAGLSLERALFPLLVLVSKFGPISVNDLADRVGRNYSTVSRQTSRLEELGLIRKANNPRDQRLTEAVVTGRGKGAADAVDGARERLAFALFAEWQKEDFDHLRTLLRRLADGLIDTPAPGSQLARLFKKRAMANRDSPAPRSGSGHNAFHAGSV